MTGHRCTGDVDTCQVCSQRRDAIEAGPLASDIEAASDRGTADLEARVYGERPTRDQPPATAYMTRRQAIEWEHRKTHRAALGLLGRAR